MDAPLALYDLDPALAPPVAAAPALSKGAVALGVLKLIVAVPVVVIGWGWVLLRGLFGAAMKVFGLYVAVGSALGALVGAVSSVAVAASSGRSHGAGTVGSLAFLGIWVVAPFFVARQYAIELYADERVRPHVDAVAEAVQPVIEQGRESAEWLGEVSFEALAALGF